MRIIVASFACCNPAVKPQDQQFLARIREALEVTNVKAQIELATATDLVNRLGEEQVRVVGPLLKRYGTAIAPMMLVDGELELYGGVPPLEKIIEVVRKRAGTIEPSASKGGLDE
jgi:hypothetical protein